MSANVKLFKDLSCTQEIKLDRPGDLGKYLLRLAPPEGINGDTGETYEVPLYVKNVGTRAALNTQFFVQADAVSSSYISIDPWFIGDMKEREVVPVKITITVPRWTIFQQLYPVIIIDYYTLPEIDERFYNPYTDAREVVT